MVVMVILQYHPQKLTDEERAVLKNSIKEYLKEKLGFDITTLIVQVILLVESTRLH